MKSAKATARVLVASLPLTGIPVIMMTGDARRETLVASMGVGASAFVAKPFTRESLNAKIAKVPSPSG